MRGSHEPRCRFIFLVQNLNTVRLLTAPAAILRNAGFATDFLFAEAVIYDSSAQSELARLGFKAATPLSLYMSERWQPSDVVIACNDWNRWVRHAFDTLRERRVRTVGLIDGCRFGEARRYRRVSRILAWGPSASEYFNQPIDIVGSANIESALKISPPPLSPVVAINNKAHFLTAAEQDAWLTSIIDVCRTIGVVYKISSHPSPKSLQIKEAVSLQEALRAASVLVSRPSTVVFEALVAGRAVVLFPDSKEPLVEFAEPMGAFAVVTSQSDLMKSILAAVEGEMDKTAIARFVDRHVSITDRPAAERIATALLRFTGYSIEGMSD